MTNNPITLPAYSPEDLRARHGDSAKHAGTIYDFLLREAGLISKRGGAGATKREREAMGGLYRLAARVAEIYAADVPAPILPSLVSAPETRLNGKVAR